MANGQTLLDLSWPRTTEHAQSKSHRSPTSEHRECLLTQFEIHSYTHRFSPIQQISVMWLWWCARSFSRNWLNKLIPFFPKKLETQGFHWGEWNLSTMFFSTLSSWKDKEGGSQSQSSVLKKSSWKRGPWNTGRNFTVWNGGKVHFTQRKYNE